MRKIISRGTREENGEKGARAREREREREKGERIIRNIVPVKSVVYGNINDNCRRDGNKRR